MWNFVVDYVREEPNMRREGLVTVNAEGGLVCCLRLLRPNAVATREYWGARHGGWEGQWGEKKSVYEMVLVDRPA